MIRLAIPAIIDGLGLTYCEYTTCYDSQSPFSLGLRYTYATTSLSCTYVFDCQHESSTIITSLWHYLVQTWLCNHHYPIHYPFTILTTLHEAPSPILINQASLVSYPPVISSNVCWCWWRMLTACPPLLLGCSGPWGTSFSQCCRRINDPTHSQHFHWWWVELVTRHTHSFVTIPNTVTSMSLCIWPSENQNYLTRNEYSQFTRCC